MNNKQGGFVTIILIAMAAIALVLGGAGAYVAWSNNKSKNTVTQNSLEIPADNSTNATEDTDTNIQEDIQPAVPPPEQPKVTSSNKVAAPVVISGNSVEALRAAFEKLKIAKIEADIKALLSKESLEQAQGGTFGAGTTANMSLVSVSRTGTDLTTGIVRVSVPNEGSGTNEQNLYFIFESGQWKLDLPKTISALFEEASQAANNPPATIEPGQTVDLAVIGFEVEPLGEGQPRYSDPEAVVRAKVKNNGTATISKIEYEYKINTDSSPGIWTLELKPGQIMNIPLRLSGYKFFAESHPEYKQGAGNYTFSIELDPDHVLPDTNRANNSASKTVYFYP